MLGLPNNLYTGISVSQRLFEFSFLNAGKGAELINTIEADKIKEKKEQLFYEVAVCYYELCQLITKQELIDFNLSRIGKMADIVKVQLQNQMSDSLQLLELELKNAQLKLNKRELQSGVKRKANYLRMLVGLHDSIQIELSNPDDASLTAQTLQPTDVNDPTQLKLLIQAQKVNDWSQKQVQSAYLPTLDFKFNLLWNSQSENLGFLSDQAFGNNISTLGLKLDIPIYHGAEKKKKLQDLEISRDILEVQKLKLEEGYALQAANATEEFELKKARYLQQNEILHLKKRYLDKASNLFDQGILSIKDLLEAQSALLEAQVKLSELLLELKLSELNYYKWSNQLIAKLE